MDSLSVSLPCPICRNAVEAEYEFSEDEDDTIGRFLTSVLRLECSDCEEVYCVRLEMVAEADIDDNRLPYDPDELEAE